MTTISDKQAERCLEKWLQYMCEIGSPYFETVRKVRNGQTYRIAMKEVGSKFHIPKP